MPSTPAILAFIHQLRARIPYGRNAVVAGLSGLTAETISRWRNAEKNGTLHKTDPTLSNVEAIAAALKISIAEITSEPTGLTAAPGVVAEARPQHPAPGPDSAKAASNLHNRDVTGRGGAADMWRDEDVRAVVDALQATQRGIAEMALRLESLEGLVLHGVRAAGTHKTSDEATGRATKRKKKVKV